MIKEALNTGKNNATSTAALMKIFGFRTSRELTAAVQEERQQQDACILSTPEGGYYLPANAEELREFINSMSGRAKNIFISIRPARKLLREWEPTDEELKRRSS